MKKLLLLSLGMALVQGAPAMAAPSPYRLLSTTPVAAMPEGDWDQLVADIATNRLYVSAEDGDAIDMFDLTTGALLKSVPANSPHKVALDKARGHLLFANGKDGTVEVLTTDLAPVKTIPVGAKPDTGILDSAARIFYVSSRDGDASATGSRISAISLDTLEVVQTFKLPAMVLKGLTMDKAGKRLFVSMRDKDAIGVVELNSGAVSVWKPEGLKKSVPLAFDAASQRLYAGSREPGRLTVIDARNGSTLQSLPATETADSASFDHEKRILYFSGDTGMSRYQLAADGTATLLETDPALVGKSSLYVGKLHRLYVMRPKKGDQVAALQIFETR
ncbi:YncE family protein [Novosphingobium terrae]|uniref:YncE family protein n=1 Tax=Novosphingobium terrae TaxID=2726189 RepID=UPI001980D48F|nr:YncE family protein [Novosphingobium terrae]